MDSKESSKSSDRSFKLPFKLRERMSSLSALTMDWIQFVLSHRRVRKKRKELDDEAVHEAQKETFGDYCDESFSAPTKRLELDRGIGPKDEFCPETRVEPPVGETWDSIEKAKAEAKERKTKKKVRIEKAIRWRLTRLSG